jgi:hypothetical protein
MTIPRQPTAEAVEARLQGSSTLNPTARRRTVCLTP